MPQSVREAGEYLVGRIPSILWYLVIKLNRRALGPAEYDFWMSVGPGHPEATSQ